MWIWSSSFFPLSEERLERTWSAGALRKHHSMCIERDFRPLNSAHILWLRCILAKCYCYFSMKGHFPQRWYSYQSAYCTWMKKVPASAWGRSWLLSRASCSEALWSPLSMHSSCRSSSCFLGQQREGEGVNKHTHKQVYTQTPKAFSINHNYTENSVTYGI